MRRIASVNGYDIFEVTKGDSEYIHDMFSSSHADIDGETTTSHDWEAWVATFRCETNIIGRELGPISSLGEFLP